MKAITWENFDGIKFQKFCNELLLLEVSKHARVFSAPGADGGVDQLYSGTYAGKAGNWRFQDKFHASDKDWTALKRDVKLDVQNNYSGEDFLVFLTNVNLSVSREKELLVIANTEFAKKGVTCEVLIWHKAFIEATIPSHPILYHWHWGDDTTMFSLPEEHFKSQLKAVTNRRNSFQNPFIGREEELNKLQAFLNSDEQSTLAIVSGGGYGKTRLCLEFMLSIEKDDSDWIPFVIAHQGYSGNELSRLLEEPGRLLLLLDNANEVPQIVEDVKRQIESTDGRIKLLLTTRNTLFNQTLGRLSSHNSDIKKAELSPLTPDATLKMLQVQLPNTHHRNLLALIDISRGVPNVILELVAAINDGQSVYNISGNNFFATTVQKIIREAADDIFSETGIEREKTIDFLQLLSIISPIRNDDESLGFISGVMGVPQDKIVVIVSHLNEIGLVEKGNTVSIKPDPYSDVILSEMCRRSTAVVNRIKSQQGAEKYVENIIKNLAEAEVPTAEKELFTQNMLRDYFQVITDENTPAKKIKQAIELARDISYIRPGMAKLAISKWIEVVINKSHAAYSEKDHYGQKSIADAINETVASLFGNLFSDALVNGKESFADLYNLLEEFLLASSHFGALNASYGFKYWQCRCAGYGVNECCTLQRFLKSIVIRYLDGSTDAFQIELALEAYDVLMELDFHGDSYSDTMNMTIHIVNYGLPECEHTKQFRLQLLEAAIRFYMSERAVRGQKEELLNTFCRHLFHASVNREARYAFNTDAEWRIRQN